MNIWARVQDNFVVEYTFTDPAESNSFHPSIKFVKVPYYFSKIGYKELKVIDGDQLVPIEDQEFDRFLTETLERMRKATLSEGKIDYHGFIFKANKENLQVIMVKLQMAEIKGPGYTCEFKAENGYITLDHENLANLFVRIEGFIEGTFKEVSTRIKKIKEIQDYEEKVQQLIITRT